jgi:nucleoside-diphosphate-sugar epimerase
LSAAIDDVDGVVHLAAISRVVWGERNPDLCFATNVVALKDLLNACLNQRRRPWVVFASSREVYGSSDRLPVREDARLQPLNVYARSKVDGERLLAEGRAAGLLTNTCRFSNVYGSTRDHPDRVVPAFAAAAAFGGRMRVEGSDNVFDFTSILDVGRALDSLIDATSNAEVLPTVHFVTGVGTSLGQLAQISAKHARAPVEVVEAPKRDYDVARFIGDPSRAERLLGWRAKVTIESGVCALISDFVRDGAPGTRHPASQSHGAETDARVQAT